jgi:hypothetical protein
MTSVEARVHPSGNFDAQFERLTAARRSSEPAVPLVRVVPAGF